MKKLEYTRENLRLLANIISKASSGTLFMRLFEDSGWDTKTTASEEYQKSGKSKEVYLFDEFLKISELGRNDSLDFIVEKTVKKDSVYFKKGDKGYKFPKESFDNLKKKMKIVLETPQKSNLRLFNDRRFCSSVVNVSKKLFIDGYYSQSILEACKVLNKKVQEVSGSNLDGKQLMLTVFSPNKPILKISSFSGQSGKDEQEGFMHLFAGLMQGIRNPKGHEIVNLKDPYRALDYLSFINLLIFKVESVKKSNDK